MRRIGLAVVLVVMFLAPLAAEAQPAGKTARIGVLVFGPVESPEEQARRSTGLFWQAVRRIGLEVALTLLVLVATATARDQGRSTDVLDERTPGGSIRKEVMPVS